MAQEYADSSFAITDPSSHDKDAVRETRAYAKSLFAEIAVRIVAFATDMVLVLFLVVFLNEHLLGSVTLPDTVRIGLWALTMIAYFTTFWTSPMRSTPMQFLFSMRVLHESGEPLSMKDAVIRSAGLVALWMVAIFLLQQFFSVPGVWLKILAVALLLYVPSVTARRQGLHDFVAHSVVINKRAIRNDEDEQRMREFLADNDPATRRSSRPSPLKMVIDAIVLAIPLYLMTMGIEISHHKNMYARTAYALHEVDEMKDMAEAWYRSTGTWPTNEEELGLPLRQNYPDGGYFQLEEGGIIRIQFEILPELRNGSILLEPSVDKGKVSWDCRTIGNIERRYVPGTCRD